MLVTKHEYVPDPRCARVRKSDTGWEIVMLDTATPCEVAALFRAYDVEFGGLDEAEDLILKPNNPASEAPSQKELEETIHRLARIFHARR